MKTVDLFCGCGGLTYGFLAAGFNVVAGVDNWQPAIQTYQSNFNHATISVDLSDWNSAIEIIKPFQPEVIIGGPPCQDFSLANKKSNDNSERANLTLSFSRIVSGVLPRVFVMENVRRFATNNKCRYILDAFQSVGYKVDIAIIDASECGVPQRRKRCFMVGILGENNLAEIYNSRLSKTTVSVRDYLGKSLDTEYFFSWPRHWGRKAVFGVDELSPTICSVNRPIPKNYKSHPADATTDLNQVRPLTTMERAWVQTFPSSFCMPISAHTIADQLIGNAVPVRLAEFVGRCIIDAL